MDISDWSIADVTTALASRAIADRSSGLVLNFFLGSIVEKARIFELRSKGLTLDARMRKPVLTRKDRGPPSSPVE